MKQFKDFIYKFLGEILVAVVIATMSALWLFHGQIIALDNGYQYNKENVELLRKEFFDFRKENKADHKEIMDYMRNK